MNITDSKTLQEMIKLEKLKLYEGVQKIIDLKKEVILIFISC